MKAAKDQGDRNMEFNGQGSPVSYKQSPKYRTNQWSGHANDGRDVNMGRGPTKGNDGSCGHSGMPMTGRHPMTAAVPSLPAQGSVRDNINRGARTPNPSGTRAFDPQAGQNYRGNADKINAGSGPRKGNQQ